MGETINRYNLLGSFQNQDAGFSRWTFAEKDGNKFFLKEFLSPVYPDQDSLTETLRLERIEECREFEKKQKLLYERVNKASDGNLVRIIEFFRCDSHYYISTPKVEVVSSSLEKISSLPMEKKLFLCKTVAHSIKMLHANHIVHADLKENNILVQKSVTGEYVGKIIDFDCSFFEENPPVSEKELSGDQVYFAPEACRFIFGETVELTCKMDVFALGLLFHQYLTGKLPEFNQADFYYAHVAVLEGEHLNISPTLPHPIRTLLEKMLECDSSKRISSNEVFNTLCNITNTSQGSRYNGYFYPAGEL